MCVFQPHVPADFCIASVFGSRKRIFFAGISFLLFIATVFSTTNFMYISGIFVLHINCRTHGGVHVDHMKNTAEVTSEEIPTPKKIIVSMQQHIGAACEPIVKKGDKVTVGQLIADSQSFMCAPIHSGVSGEVTNIGTIIMPNGTSMSAYLIVFRKACHVSAELSTFW